MRFEFATAGRIIFGEGTAHELWRYAAEFGRRALLVTGSSGERSAPFAEKLESAGVALNQFAMDGEPTLDKIRDGVRMASDFQADLIVSIGGGSAIDAGKAIAALAANGGDVLDYLEVIGSGRPLTRPSLRFIAVPTTAGTGTEVTRNAVLASPEHQVKASLRSRFMLPDLALIDPELAYDLPAAITASTGLDAFTQVIEPYVSMKANPITDLVCLEGIRLASGALLRAYRNGGDCEARKDMALASLMGGLALANAGLGAVHGFAAAIGGAFKVPHGAVCAALLPHVMAVNIRAIRARIGEGEQLARYGTIARIVTGTRDAAPEEGSAWIAELAASLNIRPLRSYGIGSADVPDLVEKGARASSMKGNPLPLTLSEMTEILSRAL
jgi:alcohol dehydrogenase class IV